MAVQSSFYVPDGNTRTFPSTKHIAIKQHVGVYLQRALDSVWVTALSTSYELVNNSIVFDSAVDNVLYIQIEIRVADTTAELADSPSNIALVAASIADVNTVADSILDVNTVADNIGAVQNTSAINPDISTVAGVSGNVTTVANSIANVNTNAINIASIDSVATTVVPNIAEILLADDNAAAALASEQAAAISEINAAASATTVADKLHTVSIIADMLLLDPLIYPNVNILGYTTANDGGGGLFNYDATKDKATANAGTIIDPSVSLALQGTGIGLGCWIRQYSGAISESWFGGNPYISLPLSTKTEAVKITDDADSVHLRLFGKVYQVEGTIVGDYTGTFLHTYRPMLPFPSDGANTFLGGRAGNLTMAPDALAIGNYLIHCAYNTGVGTQALGELTTGYNNTAVGVNAGRYCTQGYDNTFIGRDAGHNLTTGFYNTSIGISAAFANVTGNYNTALGSGAILANTSGSSNVAIGFRAGVNSTTGSYNVLIGDNSATGLTTGSSNTIIGKDVNIGDVSDTVLISAGTTKRVYIDSSGKYGFNGVAPVAPLDYFRSDSTAYNPIATDGQVGAGAGLYLYQTGSFATAVSQIVFRPRGAQPFNRIVSTGGATPYMTFCTNNSERLRIGSDGHITPYVDNTQNLGSSTNRFAVVYAGTGTINTSDILEKTFYEINEAERLCAIELKGMIRKFKFNDAIDSKGEANARIHFGVGAQYVRDVFSKYGLDPFEYAMLCYDAWEETIEEVDEDGSITQAYIPAGDRYGIRYEELLCFIISAM